MAKKKSTKKEKSIEKSLEERLAAIDVSMAVAHIVSTKKFDLENDSYNLDAFTANNLDKNDCGLWRMPFKKPSIEDLEKAYEIGKYNEDQSIANQKAAEYLRSTDWYVLRKMDSGEEIPEEIKQLRSEARKNIKK